MSRDFNFTNIVWVSDEYVAQKQDDDRSFPDNKSECRPYAVISNNNITTYIPLTTKEHADGDGYMRVNDENGNFKFGISTLYNVTNIPAAEIRNEPKNKNNITDEMYKLIQYEEGWFSDTSNIEVVIARIKELNKKERKISALKEEISRLREENQQIFIQNDRIQALEEEIKKWESDFSYQQNELVITRTILDDTKAALDKSNKLLKEKQEKIKRLEEENDKKDRIIEEQNRKIEELLRRLNPSINQSELEPTTDGPEPQSGPATDGPEPQNAPATDGPEPQSGPATDGPEPQSGPATDGPEPQSGPATDGPEPRNAPATVEAKPQSGPATATAKPKKKRKKTKNNSSGSNKDSALDTLRSLRNNCSTGLKELKELKDKHLKELIHSLYNDYLLPDIDNKIEQMKNPNASINDEVINKLKSMVKKTKNLQEKIAPPTKLLEERSDKLEYISYLYNKYFNDIKKEYKDCLEKNDYSSEKFNNNIDDIINHIKINSLKELICLYDNYNLLINRCKSNLEDITNQDIKDKISPLYEEIIACAESTIDCLPDAKISEINETKKTYTPYEQAVCKLLNTAKEIEPILTKDIYESNKNIDNNFCDKFFDDISKHFDKFMGDNGFNVILFNKNINNSIESLKNKISDACKESVDSIMEGKEQSSPLTISKYEKDNNKVPYTKSDNTGINQNEKVKSKKSQDESPSEGNILSQHSQSA